MDKNKSTFVCPAWLAPTLLFPWRRFWHRPERILAPYIHEGDRVFDIGCGPGFFTVPMARMVGESGEVVAVDLQERMLAMTRRRAERAGIASRLQLHHCPSDRLDLPGQADFILAFFMVHESPSPLALFREVGAALKQNGRFLMVEPIFHVSRRRFAEQLDQLNQAGLQVVDRPRVPLGYTALAAKQTGQA